MSVSDFYERYWKKVGGSPADNDFALVERKTKLQTALSSVHKGNLILDAGCGNGQFSRFMYELGYKINGIDISMTAVQRAGKLVPDGCFEVASLEGKLPYANNVFAAVWCTEVLEHLFDVHAALSELNRVLQQGGVLIVTTPYHGLIKNILITLFGFEQHYNPYISHIRFYTRKSLNMCLTRAGFTPISWDGVGRRWPIWMSHFVVVQKTGQPSPAPEIIG